MPRRAPVYLLPEMYGVAGQRFSWGAFVSMVAMLLLVIAAVTLPGARRHFRERVAWRRAAKLQRRQARLQRRMAAATHHA
jgi:hypothetical protein